MVQVNSDYYTRNSRGGSWIGSEEDARPLREGAGPIGTIGHTTARFRQEEPVLVTGGAGSGKFTTLGAYQLGHPSTESFFVLDVGGQYQSVTWHDNLAMGRKAYSINPQGISGYPTINHPVDLWGILKPDDPYLYDNARRIAVMGLKDDAKGENAWVGQDGARWLTGSK